MLFDWISHFFSYLSLCWFPVWNWLKWKSCPWFIFSDKVFPFKWCLEIYIFSIVFFLCFNHSLKTGLLNHFDLKNLYFFIGASHSEESQSIHQHQQQQTLQKRYCKTKANYIFLSNILDLYGFNLQDWYIFLFFIV